MWSDKVSKEKSVTVQSSCVKETERISRWISRFLSKDFREILFIYLFIFFFFVFIYFSSFLFISFYAIDFFISYLIPTLLKIEIGLVDWGCKIHQLQVCREVRRPQRMS